MMIFKLKEVKFVGKTIFIVENIDLCMLEFGFRCYYILYV